MGDAGTKGHLASATEVVCSKPSMPEYHIVIGNGTSQVGGMCAHMSLLAEGLSETGEVHVWEPAKTELGTVSAAVKIHKTLGDLWIGGFRRTGRALRSFAKPRRLLVYWVPHAYGYRSMNLPFCIWIWLRSVWHKDRVELMVQECFLAFHEGGWRQDAAAVVHRVMMVFMLGAAQHVWIALTGYERTLRPFALGRRPTFGWLPVPSNVQVAEDPAAVNRIRHQLAPSGFLIGHFGTFGSFIADLMEAIAPAILRGLPGSLVLLGSGSERFRERLVRQHPDLAARIHATGYMTDAALSSYLAACDVMIQPYPDGITARRGSSLAPLAHGRPIVTNASGPTEPFWKETGAVMLAESTPQGFLEAVRSLQNNAAQRELLGAIARKIYQRYFHPSHMVETIANHA
jgi:glycosyltransferase involved in cell wall biosynthesis